MEKLILKYKKILTYGLISAFVTLVDILICKLLDKPLGAVPANTCGVIAGFFLHYFLSAKTVFQRRDKKSFLIYAVTSAFGLLFADLIVHICRNMFDSLNVFTENIRFITAKTASIVLPFFAMYFARKYLFAAINKDKGENR